MLGPCLGAGTLSGGAHSKTRLDLAPRFGRPPRACPFPSLGPTPFNSAAAKEPTKQKAFFLVGS